MHCAELNELALAAKAGRRPELNELLLNDFDPNLHSDTTQHSGQPSKHSQQGAPFLQPGDEPRAGGLGFPLEETKNCSSSPPKQLETRWTEPSLSRTEPVR